MKISQQQLCCELLNNYLDTEEALSRFSDDIYNDGFIYTISKNSDKYDIFEDSIIQVLNHPYKLTIIDVDNFKKIKKSL
jgi:hypothetical protein